MVISVKTLKENAQIAVARAKQEVSNLPNGREKSVVLTKLDEARHWIGDVAEGTAVVVADQPKA